jgi:autophagy-related protein 9
VAKFVSFVAGSFAALLLVISLLDENLLEVPMAGRNLVWWLALTGILLTIRWVCLHIYNDNII